MKKMDKFRIFVRRLMGLCTKCGREKGPWRDRGCIYYLCYHCDLDYKDDKEREKIFKFMGWNKRYHVKF